MPQTKLFRKKKVPKQQATAADLLGTETYREKLKKQLGIAIAEEAVLLKFLSMIWLAGPVTYIALHLSFRVGYGKEPPSALFFYLVVYTVVTSCITVFANIIHKTFTSEKKLRMEQLQAECLSKLPDLIFLFRNLRISRLKPEEQRLQSALLLLRDPDASESSIQTAIEDLTGSVELARSYRVIESYRRKGIIARIELEAERVWQRHKDDLQKVYETHPGLKPILENRLYGRAPSKRLGQRRKPHFLSELMTHANHLRPQMIDLVGGEELMKLCLELLLGREYKIILWQFVGESDLSAEFKKMDRRKIRLEQVKKTKRQKIRELIEVIEEKNDSPFSVFEKLDHISLTDPKAERIAAAADEIEEELKQIKLLNHQIQRHEELVFATQEKLAKTLEKRNFDERTGIRVESRSLKLTEKQRQALATDLSQYLSPLAFRGDRTGLVVLSEEDDEIERNTKTLGLEEVRTLIFKILLILDRHLDLGREYIVDSLEASRSFNLMMLDPSLSRRTKINWMSAVLEELEDDNFPAVARSARRLVRQCGTTLPPTFARTYEKIYGVKISDVSSSSA